MFKKFILWLVVKFLTPRERLQLVVNDNFADNPRRVIDNLYHLTHSDIKTKTFEPFARVAAKALAEYDLSGNVYVTVLYALKQKLFRCPVAQCASDDYLEFFRKVNIIKDHSNRLKVTKDLTNLIISETTFGTEQDITLVVNVLQHQYLDPEIIAKFLTAGESK